MKLLVSFIPIIILVSFVHSVACTQVTKVDAVGITVKHMNRSLRFYTDVLGFTKVSDITLQGPPYENLTGVFGLNMRVVRMRLGDEFIELTDYLTTGGRSIPEDQHSNDLIFQHIAIVVSDMEKAYKHLQKYSIEYVSTSPQTLPESIPAAAGIKAFYFHDPDNHNMELIFFPTGKGQTKWHLNNGKLFLGIDHTAIGVSNSEDSHKFYSDLLGLERKGDSWNKGTEQEHLNNVEGASLHITGYRAKNGPGVEFLQYIVPGPGKQYPADTRADDLWFWQTVVVTDNSQKLFDQLKAANYLFFSKQDGSVVETGFYRKSFIVKDPDGHAVLVIEAKK